MQQEEGTVQCIKLNNSSFPVNAFLRARFRRCRQKNKYYILIEACEFVEELLHLKSRSIKLQQGKKYQSRESILFIPFNAIQFFVVAFIMHFIYHMHANRNE